VNAAAAAEVPALAARGLLNPRLLAVHVVGPAASGVAALRASGAAVVWCPSSNLFLFGRTAPAALLAPGMDVLLGSDSLLTADGDLLAELRTAARLGALDADRLHAAVGTIAARRLGLPTPRLEPGARADLVVLRKPPGQAETADVAVVVAGGVLRVLDPVLLPPTGAWRESGSCITLGGVTRWISGPPPPDLPNGGYSGRSLSTASGLSAGGGAASPTPAPGAGSGVRNVTTACAIAPATNAIRPTQNG
jgi:hypothetical protein